MNCKNCGAPVDGHIACPKCGQLVDFSGGVSQSEPRSSYGIDWGAAETPAATAGVESAKENKVEPVVEQVKDESVEPVVELAKEAKTKVENSVEEISIKQEQEIENKAEATSVSKQVFEPANNTKVEPVTGKPVVEAKAKTEDKPVIETTEKPVAENSVKTAPVVAESRTDTSEDESEDISIFDTFSEAMKDIAEDVLEVGDDMKEDIADAVENITDAVENIADAITAGSDDDDEEDNSAAVTSSSIAAEDKEEEPYRYKENKYEFSGSAKSSGTYNSGTYNNSKKNNDDVDSKPAAFSLFLFFAFIIMALVISGTRNNKEDEYEKAKQELYNNVDFESLQNMYGLNLHNSSSSSTV